MRRKVHAGITSVMLPIFVRDTTSTTGGGLSGLLYNTASLVGEYRRQGAATWTAITLVTATLGTYTSGGFIADGGLAGSYEVCPPDAAFAAGAKSVVVRYYGAANMLPVIVEFELDAVDYQNSTSFGLTDIDAAISSRSTYAGGAVASVTGNVGGSVVGDVEGKVLGGGASAFTAAGVEALDGSGAALATAVNLSTLQTSVNNLPVIATGTAQAGAASTITLTAGASATDGSYVGSIIYITSGTGATLGARVITGYVGATKIATVDTAWTTAPDATSHYVIWATHAASLNSSLQDTAASVVGAVGSVTGAVGSVTGNVGGNVVGSVGSVTGAVGSITGVTFPTNFSVLAITAVTGLVSVGTLANNVITAASINAAALNGKGDWLLSSSYTAPTNLTVAQIATGVWQDATAGDFTAASSIGKSLYTSGNVPGAAAGLFIAGTNAATTIGGSSIQNIVWDEVLTGGTHNIVNSAGRRLRILQSLLLVDGTLVSGGAIGTATCTLDSSAAATDRVYEQNLIVITSGSGAGQTRMILQYTAAKVATLDRPWDVATDNTSTYTILGDAGVIIVTNGVATAGGASSITLAANALAVANSYIGCIITIGAGTGAGQSRLITAYTTGRVATVSPAWETAPDTTSAYKVLPDCRSIVDSGTITTVSDKTGYSLTQAFPANFASLLVTVAGQVTTTYAIHKNTALNNFEFVMYGTDHVTPTTALTVAGQVSLDGAAFVNLANAVAEVGSGVYKVNLATTDTNANVLTLKFTATGADTTLITIPTQS